MRIILLLLHLRLPTKHPTPIPRLDRRHQIHNKTRHIERKDETHSPFEDRAGVVGSVEAASGECDGEAYFKEDKSEFEPEGYAEDEVLSVFYPRFSPLHFSHLEDPKIKKREGEEQLTNSQFLIFPTYENCANDIPPHEQQQEDIMQDVIVPRIEDAQQDQARGADERKEYTQAAEHLFGCGEVPRQTAAVPEPALREKGGVNEESCDGRAGDEEGLDGGSTNVGDVGYGLGGILGG